MTFQKTAGVIRAALLLIITFQAALSNEWQAQRFAGRSSPGVERVSDAGLSLVRYDSFVTSQSSIQLTQFETCQSTVTLGGLRLRGGHENSEARDESKRVAARRENIGEQIDLDGHGGLIFEHIEIGNGKPCPDHGVHVFIHFKGWLQSNMSLFNDTRAAPSSTGAPPPPVRFTLSNSGDRLVHDGGVDAWAAAVRLMRCGGRARVAARSAHAHGANGSADGRVPPHAAVVYELELMRFGHVDIHEDGSVLVTYLPRAGQTAAREPIGSWRTPFGTGGARAARIEVALRFTARCGGVEFDGTGGAVERFALIPGDAPTDVFGPYSEAPGGGGGGGGSGGGDGGGDDDGEVVPDREESGRLPAGVLAALRHELTLGTRSNILLQPQMAFGPAGRPPHVPPGAEVEYELELVTWSSTYDVFPERSPGAVLVTLLDTLDRYENAIEDASRVHMTLHGRLIPSTGVPAQRWATRVAADFLPKLEWTGAIGDGALPESLEASLYKVKETQTAVVAVGGPFLPAMAEWLDKAYRDQGVDWPREEASAANATVEILLKVVKVEPLFEMDLSTKLLSVEARRARGCQQYELREFEQALGRFDHAHSLIQWEKGNGLEEQERLKELKVALLCNKAACLLALNRSVDAIGTCNEVLAMRAHCVKALVRRGKAYGRINKAELARLDLRKALELEPGHAGATAELRRLDNLQAKVDSVAKPAFARMFGVRPRPAPVKNDSEAIGVATANTPPPQPAYTENDVAAVARMLENDDLDVDTIVNAISRQTINSGVENATEKLLEGSKYFQEWVRAGRP